MENKEILKNFKETYRLNDKSEKTIEAYERIVNQLEKVINKNFSDLNMLDVNKFKSYMKDKDYSYNTIAQYLMCLRSFIKFMKKYNIMDNDFSKDIELPNKPRNIEEKKYMSVEEQLKFIKFLNNLTKNKTNTTHKLILTLILTTGARKTEILKLKSTDINFENDAILLNGKGNKQRYVALYPPIKDDLKEYIDKYSTENFIFTYSGKQISAPTINKALKRLLKNAELYNGYTVHDLRHACASAMYNNGATLEEIKMALGHENISTTEKVYVHFNQKKQMSGFAKNPLFK